MRRDEILALADRKFMRELKKKRLRELKQYLSLLALLKKKGSVKFNVNVKSGG